MAGMNVGSLQADRSAVEPAFLLSGDIGYRGGGTSNAGETDAMMSNYENVFGPAARDIKWDSQRHKRHQRWHLPDALKGSNSFLTDRIDGLITDATSSPFTKNILPYRYWENPDSKIKWNVYSFDEGMASRVPYESAARVLPQSKRSFAGYAVRQGLAIVMEHNFMMSPAGMENFRRQLMQLVGSIQLTNDLDVHMALLYAQSYQKQMDEKYWDGSKTLTQMCRMYVDLFGFVQKNENALDYLIEDAKNHLTQWGSKPPTFMLCNGALTRQLTMTPERTNYITAGPDGKRKLAQGPDLPSYRGLSIVHTRQFSLEAGSAPRDMLRRRVRVSEHFRIPWNLRNMHARYEFYDQARDSMFYLSWLDLWRASWPQEVRGLARFEVDTNNLLPFAGEAFDRDDINLCREVFSFRAAGGGGGAVAEDANGAAMRAAAENGTLRGLLFSAAEIKLGALMGIWSPVIPDPAAPPGVPVYFYQDLEFVCRVLDAPAGGKASYASATFSQNLLNTNVLFHIIAMLIVKKYFKSKFGGIVRDLPEPTPGTCDAIIAALNIATGDRGLDLGIQDSDTVSDILTRISNAWKAASVDVTTGVQKYIAHGLAIKEWGLGNSNDVQCLAADLFVLRPNIEHYMLGVIFGRGGGVDELGATFWGQTELSCYDDSQHGIWGMSYKYHERAIVTNERNLIRVFDVCFDGYCGGNDARILNWNSADCDEFARATQNLTTAYTGPSMIVMSLPRYTNVYKAFPNPIVWHPTMPDATRMKVQPDRGGSPSSVQAHCPFANYNGADDEQRLRHQVYGMYYKALGLQLWAQMHTPLDPGHLAYANETDPYVFSFQGHMATIVDGQREETQGSGHLGSNFVGVASVREGRGMLPRGMPTLTHLV